MADGQGTIVSESSAGNAGTDWSALGAAGVQAGSGILGSILNARQARKSREWQEKMWHLQNEYNLPVNQVARLKDAGINPNLAFGSAASTMSANIPSSPARAQFDDFGIGAAARTYFQYKLEKQNVLAEIRARNAATRQQELQNDFMSAVLQDKIMASLWGFRADAAKGRWFSGHNDEWYGAEYDLKTFRRDLMKAETSLAEARRDLTRKNYDRAVQDYNHLVNKYSYEDAYYKRGLNPYETSTLAGALRSGFGLAGHLFSDPGSVGADFSLLIDPIKSDLHTLWNTLKTKEYDKAKRKFNKK